MPDQRTAILRLLDDDDAETIALMQRKLSEIETLDGLRELRADASGRAAEHLDEVIRELAQGKADTAFSELCARFGEHGDLEQASWLLAATFAPVENFEPIRAVLDLWGFEVTRRLTGVLTKADRVRVLAEFLGRDMRLRGNDDDYYQIDNSLLPRVLETKLGIPISLALVYMLVAKRAGFQVDGVGLPGHFLARHEDVFFDPFHGGRRVSLEECAALLEQQNLALTPAHLMPTTSRQVLIRMLTNIFFIAEQRDPVLGEKVSVWLEALRNG
jgi:hypothetical protein